MECKDSCWLNTHALVKAILIWKDMIHWEECPRGEDNVYVRVIAQHLDGAISGLPMSYSNLQRCFLSTGGGR